MKQSSATAAPSFEALLNRDDIIWMGQNTNHLDPLPAVIEALELSIRRREFQVYAPAAGLSELRAAIVDDLGAPGLDAWITDGAVSGLHQLCVTLASRISQLVTSDPGWPWPGRFAGVEGVPVVAVPVYESDRRLLTAEQIRAVIQPRSLLYLIDPLNPLGSSYTRDELVAIVELARETDSLIIHDCTYRHFADGHTLAAELAPERVFTTYSFSKWLGLAGLRLGAIVAEPGLLAEVMAVPGNPLGASLPAQRAAIAGLKEKASWLATLRSVNRANLETVERIVASSGLGEMVVSPSHGNFCAVDISASEWTAEALCEAMLDQGVFIRPGSYQSPGFGDRFVKISTSVPPEWVTRFGEVWTALAKTGRKA